MIVTRLASQIVEGNLLTDSEGRFSRIVAEVDKISNVHGKIIFRTANSRGKITGSTVADADTVLHVMV